MNESVRVFLCDDVPDIRMLMRFALEEDPTLQVVGEADDGLAAVEGIGSMQPDIVLLDLSMPGLDGLEVITRLRDVAPGTGIIVFSGFAADRMSVVALDQGADRYLEKGEPLEVVRACARSRPRAQARGLAPGRRVAPGRRLAGLAAGALEQGDAQPGAPRLGRGRDGRRGVAHELLDRRDHRRRLLGGDIGGDEGQLGTAVDHRPEGIVRRRMPEVPVLDHDAVLAAVAPADAIERVRDAFVRHHAGEWTMPAKVYLQSPPFGDFRAMPALGGELALLKWITSFPGNPAQGLPTVTGIVCLSDARTGAPVMLLDARSVTALRTGAVAAVASAALAREDARAVGIVGCGLHGAWSARCLAAAGYGPGVCFDPRAEAAEALAAELGLGGGRAGRRRSPVTSCAASPRARSR